MDLSRIVTAQSLWRERPADKWTFYCPLCASTRLVPFKPRPELKHFFQVGVAAAFFTVATWSWFQWKGLVSFLPFWITFEAIYRIRVRGAVRCSNCGFDPFLYLTDSKKARVEVESHWRKKFEEKGIPFSEKSPVSPESSL